MLDSKMKELSSRGLGLDKKKAEIIAEEQESIMWSKGVLGRNTPSTTFGHGTYSFSWAYTLLSKLARNIEI